MKPKNVTEKINLWIGFFKAEAKNILGISPKEVLISQPMNKELQLFGSSQNGEAESSDSESIYTERNKHA